MALDKCIEGAHPNGCRPNYNKWAQLGEGLRGALVLLVSMERVAVVVDAGYLFAQGSIELSGAWLPQRKSS